MNHDVGEVAWHDHIPPRPPAFIPVVSPKPNQKLTCLVTSPSWIGVYTHYYDERTRPCTGSELDCEGCYRKLARRWKAYLCAVTLGNGRKCIVELTQGAMEACPGLVDRGTVFRGKRIVLWRGGSSRNGPVHCRLEQSAADLFVPEPFDLMTALHLIWGLQPPGQTK